MYEHKVGKKSCKVYLGHWYPVSVAKYNKISNILENLLVKSRSRRCFHETW